MIDIIRPSCEALSSSLRRFAQDSSSAQTCTQPMLFPESFFVLVGKQLQPAGPLIMRIGLLKARRPPRDLSPEIRTS